MKRKIKKTGKEENKVRTRQKFSPDKIIKMNKGKNRVISKGLEE